ncbi:MAG: hypothetical protein PHH54_05670 [Candidatus Nanoarchaeia archaeon]|nr:hypothetical protein [Candidatus Nanoarchaeia archaeon]MDD5741447.1 hypothetical protein [Candidatus Nanoarchaeia archaeon]
MGKQILINFSEELLKKLKEKADELGFNSIEEYVLFVLEQVTSDAEKGKGINKEEREIQEKKLRDLGYL